ncbi:MAG: VanZ family protein [Lachnospiraceae bacterium]|nr:VanZ family protein [Lachnospiraceae bacterium]
MNARTVNISSLVILLALLSLICEGFLYYFLPLQALTVVFAVMVSLILSHFFLETSLSYAYNAVYAAFMTIGTFIFSVIVYYIQPNQWLQYDFILVFIVLANWLTPFLYCTFRDLHDISPRFSGYNKFFRQMSILLLLCYIFALAKQYYLTPIVPPYQEGSFGAQNFVPFMATGSYLEEALRKNTTLFPLFCYILEMIFLYIPFGYYVSAYMKKIFFPVRLFLYLAYPAIMEMSQYIFGRGRAHIDDYTLALFGILIGSLIFHATCGIFRMVADREFLSPRNTLNLSRFLK